MQAVILRELGDPDRLLLETVADPEPGPGEVRVRLAAAALNHRDVWIRRGRYARIRLPVILGSDGAGQIDAVGEGVSTDLVGRRVVIDPSLAWGDNPRVQDPAAYGILGMPRDGTYAEAVVVPAAQVHDCPAHLSDTEAAALPLAGLTAWRAVVSRGELRSGSRVLVTGIGGGVAAFALLWARSLGAEVWVTSGDPAKIERAREQGAAGGVSYRDADWGRQLVAAAGSEFDLIVDGAGGEGFATLIDVADYGSRLVHYGATTGNPTGFDLRRVFWRQIDIRGTTMGHGGEFAAMLAHVAAKELRPAIDQVFPLVDVAAAHARMEAAGQFGKIVLATR